MAEDRPPKSAYELALERLEREDREAGVEDRAPLTSEQKQEIARLRQEAQAKLAELEILHRKNVQATGGEAEKLRELEERYRIDRGRVESSLESALARVRRER
jgi:hypothetical protein